MFSDTSGHRFDLAPITGGLDLFHRPLMDDEECFICAYLFKLKPLHLLLKHKVEPDI